VKLSARHRDGAGSIYAPRRVGWITHDYGNRWPVQLSHVAPARLARRNVPFTFVYARQRPPYIGAALCEAWTEVSEAIASVTSPILLRIDGLRVSTICCAEDR